MSEHQVDAGWWQAQDGKWYPPHLHPGYTALVAEVTESTATPSWPPASLQTDEEQGQPLRGDPSWKPPRSLRPKRFSWSWFSPPAAAAVVLCICAVAAVAIDPSLFTVAAAVAITAWQTTKAVFRFRDGHGAGAMTVAALVLFAATTVYGLAELAGNLGSAFTTAGSIATEGAGTAPSAPEPYIHWQEFTTGECFDLGMSHSGISYRKPCSEPHDGEAVGEASIDSSEAERAGASASGDTNAYWNERAGLACELALAARSGPPLPPYVFVFHYREDPEARLLDPDEPMTLRAKVLCVAVHAEGAKLLQSYSSGG